jgi:hypothetical protein
MSKPNTCPLLKRTCIERDCKFWVHLIGKNPNTGQDMDTFDCSWLWVPALLMRVAGEERHTAAAVEDMRNLLHRGLTGQLTNNDMALQYDDVAEQPPRLNGNNHGRN